MNLFRAMFTRKWILASLLVLAGTALCARLGIWQLDRLAQRRAFNEHYLVTSVSTPLMLTATPKENLLDMEYRMVTVTGTYDPVNQVVLRNQFHDNQPGYFLLTPLLLSDGSAVMIERGWIPAIGNAAPSDWHQYDQTGAVTITGILRLGQSQPEVGGSPDPPLAAGQTHLDFWNMVNTERIAKQVPYPLLPIFIQPEPEPAPSSPPYPYQPVIEISEGPHMGYALQWFTFAAMLFFGYPFFLCKQLGAPTKD
jgi:surfeit locus 1 family protein